MSENIKKEQVFTKYEMFLIAILAFLQFTIILDFMVLSPLSAILLPELEITPAQFSLVVSVYAISAGLSGLLAAGFADKYDRKKLLLFFYTGFIIGTFLCGFAPDYTSLLIARVVTGIFGGVIGAEQRFPGNFLLDLNFIIPIGRSFDVNLQARNALDGSYKVPKNGLAETPLPLPDLRWLRLLVVMGAGNYGFWAYIFWSLGRSEGDPTPVLVAACLGLAASALAALRWPARAAWALFAFGLLGWLTYVRLALTSAEAGPPPWVGLLLTVAFFFPAFALGWLSRAIGRAFRPRPQDPNRP